MLSATLGFGEGDSKLEKPRMLMAKADEQVIHFLFELYNLPPSGDYIPPPEEANWPWFRAQKLAKASFGESVLLSLSSRLV